MTAGGRHERLEQNGIAHFLEHMAFKGTPTRTARAIAEEIEDVGGYINAYTGKEMTAYYARVLEADVERAIGILADIVLNPLFEVPDIEVERGVILQEIGQALDTPDDIIFDWLQEAAYPAQPFGRTILGPAERVSGFGRPDLAGFVGEHYGPDRMILAAAGRGRSRTAAGAGGAALRPSRRGGRRCRCCRRASPAASGARRATSSRCTWRWPSRAPACARMRPMRRRSTRPRSAAACRRGSSRSCRERRGLCYTIFAQAGAYEDTGLITLYAGTGPEQIRELTELTMDELRRAADGLSAAELDRARAQLKAGMLMGLESPSARAERLARMLSIWGRVPTIDEVVAKIDAVTLERVRAFGEGLAARADPALALLGPVEDAPDRAALARRLAA